MAQQKPPPGGKPAAKKGTTHPAGKPGSGASAKANAAKASGSKASAAKGSPSKPSAAKVSMTKGATAKVSTDKGAPPPRKAAPRKPGKSIVNQKQRPWGLIITTAAVVLFAAAVVVVVIVTRKDSNDAQSSTKGGQKVDKNDPYRQPGLPAALAIKGVTYKVEGQHDHVNGHIKYDVTPPIGGNHSQYWANCAGDVYTHQIADENAVHMLEHGAVWITYNPKTLPEAGVTKLATYVTGQDRLAMSPYEGLKAPISLQSWGYQLFVDSASDPRIAQFISTLKYNPKTSPEPQASCTDPYWDASKSTFGHPQN